MIRGNYFLTVSGSKDKSRDKRLFGFSVTNYRELSMNFTTNYSFYHEFH